MKERWFSAISSKIINKIISQIVTFYGNCVQLLANMQWLGINICQFEIKIYCLVFLMKITYIQLENAFGSFSTPNISIWLSFHFQTSFHARYRTITFSSMHSIAHIASHSICNKITFWDLAFFTEDFVHKRVIKLVMWIATLE